MVNTSPKHFTQIQEVKTYNKILKSKNKTGLLNQDDLMNWTCFQLRVIVRNKIAETL
jgi:hypothetical protein